LERLDPWEVPVKTDIIALALLCSFGLAALCGAAYSAPVVKWDRFYDRAGNEVAPPGGTDGVSGDSLYFKEYQVNSLRASGKVADPAPVNRTTMNWLYDQCVPCMRPDGLFVYEVNDVNLRRYSTADGSVTNYYLASGGDRACGTDGRFLYMPSGVNSVYKYTLTGLFISETAVDIIPVSRAFAVVRDTVWMSENETGATTYYGYACSKFVGGEVTYDASWYIGDVGGCSMMNIAWDGTYYYAVAGGYAENPFFRFNADRTLYSRGTVVGDIRSVMCAGPATGPRVLIAGCYETGASIKRLADTLAMYAGGFFGAFDTINAAHSAPPSAESLWNAGYRAILTYSDAPYQDSAAWGDMLADFVELGGGVVVTVFADEAGEELQGRWNPRYTLWDVNAGAYASGTLGTVHAPEHPIMRGVATVACANFRTAATTPLVSPYITRVADWAESTLQCVAYDSAGRRVVYLGFYAAAPFADTPSPLTGNWITQVNNALLWAAPLDHDVGVASIIAPGGTVDSGAQITPKAEVRNYGRSAEDFAVNLTVDGGYYQTEQVTLAPGAVDTVSFMDWFAEPTGALQVTAWTTLVGDQNNGNDTCQRVVEVEAPAPGVAEEKGLPRVFSLGAARPSPFARSTALRYGVPKPAAVELAVYSVAGTLVRTLVSGEQSAGWHSRQWNGRDDAGRPVSRGIYYCRLTSEGSVTGQKLIKLD
jgi:hypothetical protein